ncbi:MAG: adenylate/guanylate cyclase domain-containing protein [Desulfobacteraceae bacterium]
MEERAKRKLSAILSADVKGYSRLMGEDELATVRTLEAYREMIAEIIRNYSGRVVDSPGDNLLAEFSSVVDAVESAIEIQKELKFKNEGLPEKRRMEFRIGINLGDVIEEGGRIYGDGVNVAARIERLANAGGISISGTAFDQVEAKLRVEFEYVGEQSVKNIKKPVRVYQVKMDSRLSGIQTSQELLLPDKPSIAVLPFVNMSNDPEQEYFSDGITEDIITNLSKVSGLFVISRNSSFLYKGKQVKIQEVAKDLGVHYVLEGSVRRAGDKVRITAQLIDGNTENHVWAEKYDRELQDIFSVQDEVTQRVVSELAVALTVTESDRLPRKHTKNFEAYDMYLRSKKELYGQKKENTLKALEMSQRVIDLDPNFAGGYQIQSFLLSRAIRFGWSESPSEDLEKALKLAQKAISVDDKFPLSYVALASVYLTQGKHDEALAAANRAAAILPGDADTIVWLGYYLNWVGRAEEAITAIKKARELNPMYLHGGWPVYLAFMGFACFTAGLYEESIWNVKKAIEQYGSSLWYPFLIASYSILGRKEEAKRSTEQYLKANPTFSLSSWTFGRLYKNSEDSERLYDALREAGLPE